MNSKVLIAALTSAMAMASASTASNLLTNGNFEGSTSETTTPPGWTNIGHMDGVIAYSLFGTPAYDGSYYYDIGGFGGALPAGGDGIEQTVATVAGQAYTLTFGLSGENGSGVELADVNIGGKLTQYTLTVDGSGPFKMPFATDTISYVATGPTTTIAFTVDAASPAFGNNDPLIDGVIFSPTGVPEPTTWAMMLAGFGMAGAAIRRRRTAISAA